jgi:uncharacterized membrane protein
MTRPASAKKRLIVSVAAGIIAAIALVLLGAAKFAPLGAWDATADILLIIASVASLVAVGFMITEASSSSGIEKAIEIALGLFSVIASWAVVHSTYTLKYAKIFYTDPEGGVDFNSSGPPKYSDFAYVAFTVGLTFQVSDTNIQTNELRRTILKHALLSYLFGAVIIATTINTIANLGK